jgi:polyisoprenoid-binding protein YceI
MRFSSAATLGLAIAVTAIAPANTASIAVPSGIYKLDPKHSEVVFGIKHMGISTFYGRFAKLTGLLNFDPAKPEQSTLNVQIDTSAIDTHVPDLDKELAGSAVFDTVKYPIASFRVTGVERTGDKTGTVNGTLTIRDVSRPVTLNVTFNGGTPSPIPFQPYRIGFDATATVKRSDFGLAEKTFWSAMVGDSVSLQIEAEFERQ